MKVGFIGWRGMVGSVLMDRMASEKDFTQRTYDPVFFSTSQVGQPSPAVIRNLPPLADARDLDALAEMDVIVTCQGGAYTEETYFPLRAAGWDGYWIDAASRLRMEDDAVIVLDPVNRHVIDKALEDGGRTFVGANCTVSLLLMAIQGLLDEDLVEWVSSMTYQAASGGGARHMRELVDGMAVLGAAGTAVEPAAGALELDRVVTETLRSDAFPTQQFLTPLAASLIPWIYRQVENGQTREDWMAMAEANKILGLDAPIPFDGICVRVGAMRCHSQALTIKLKRDVPLEELEHMLNGANSWVGMVLNSPEATRQYLTPAGVSGTLDIPIGRVHKLAMGPMYLGAFTVGDQLLWGAAEPIRRMLRILCQQEPMSG